MNAGKVVGVLFCMLLALSMVMNECLCDMPDGVFHTVTVEVDAYYSDNAEVWPYFVGYVGRCTGYPATVAAGGSFQVVASYWGGTCGLNGDHLVVNGVAFDVASPEFHEDQWLSYGPLVVGPVYEDILVEADFTGCG